MLLAALVPRASTSLHARSQYFPLDSLSGSNNASNFLRILGFSSRLGMRSQSILVGHFRFMPSGITFAAARWAVQNVIESVNGASSPSGLPARGAAQDFATTDSRSFMRCLDNGDGRASSQKGQRRVTGAGNSASLSRSCFLTSVRGREDEASALLRKVSARRRSTIRIKTHMRCRFRAGVPGSPFFVT